MVDGAKGEARDSQKEQGPSRGRGSFTSREGAEDLGSWETRSAAAIESGEEVEEVVDGDAAVGVAQAAAVIDVGGAADAEAGVVFAVVGGGAVDGGGVVDAEADGVGAWSEGGVFQEPRTPLTMLEVPVLMVVQPWESPPVYSRTHRFG
jgi:hypothetical protein